MNNLMTILDGYKTFLAGLGMIAAGIGILVKPFSEGMFFGEATMEGYQMVMGGLALWGIGHKLDKQT